MKNSKSQKTKALGDELGQQIDALRKDLTNLMASASDDVSEGLDQAGHQISQTSKHARKLATRSVVEHPLAAVGIAVGVGLLVGMVARKQ